MADKPVVIPKEFMQLVDALTHESVLAQELFAVRKQIKHLQRQLGPALTGSARSA